MGYNKNMPTYICPSYEKEILFHELFRDQGNTGCSAIPLERILSMPEEDPSRLLYFLQKISQQQNDFPLTKQMFRYSAFFQEVFSFAQELTLLGISPEILPSRTRRETELKQIVSTACIFCSEEQNAAENARKLIHENSKEDFVLVPYSTSSLFLQKVLVKLSGSLPALSFRTTAGKMLLRHALSSPAEIEAAAQDLIRNPKTANIVLCSPQTQLPVVEAIFRQYAIDFSCTICREPVQLPAAFRALVLFALHRDPAHLKQAAIHQGFTASLSEEAADWLEQHLNSNLKYQPSGNFYAEKMAESAGRKDDPAHRTDDVSRILRMDQICTQWLAAAEEEMHMLENCSPESAYRNAYQILSRSPLLQSEAERKAGLHLRKQISSLLGRMQSAQDAEMMLESITADEISGSSFSTDRILVTDLMHPVPAKQITYVLGCTGTAYPGTPVRQGLFDEQYLSCIPEYPDLASRNHLYLQQIGWIEKSAETVIYSYPTNDSKGRTLIPAFELSGLPDERWQIQRCSAFHPAPHQLNPETAFRLFTKQEGAHSLIRGSVSSIETWFQCPYHAFLSSGLYVREKELPALDAATIGTLQHAVMENAMRKAGTDYAAYLNKETITALLSPCFEALEAADPLHQDLLEFSRERLTRSLVLSAEFLQLYSRHTALQPWKPETRFDRYDVTPHVRLNGTVDRMDYDPDSHQLAVIDYKSSAKSLSPGKYAEGLQLQLLSYLFSILEGCPGPQDPDLRPAAAVYFSLKEAYPPAMPAVRVSRTRFEVTETDFSEESSDTRRAYASARALKGWKLISDSDLLDDTGILVSGKVYRLEELRSILTEVYEWFYDSITGTNSIRKEPENGELPSGIALRPVNGACTFCEDAAICRFHGEYRIPGGITAAPKAVTRSGKEKKS